MPLPTAALEIYRAVAPAMQAFARLTKPAVSLLSRSTTAVLFLLGAHKSDGPTVSVVQASVVVSVVVELSVEVVVEVTVVGTVVVEVSVTQPGGRPLGSTGPPLAVVQASVEVEVTVVVPPSTVVVVSGAVLTDVTVAVTVPEFPSATLVLDTVGSGRPGHDCEGIGPAKSACASPAWL